MKKFNGQGVLTAVATEESEINKGIHGGKYDIVFFTPESLINSKRWREVLTSNIYG